MGRYLLSEDGEIVDQMYVGDRILRNSSLEAYNKSVKINEGISFVKLYTNNLDEIADRLTGPQLMTMFRLLPYIQYGSGFLVNSNHGLLARPAIMKILKKNARQTDKDLETLVKVELLGKVRTGKYITYMVNPYVFCVGATVFEVLHKAFAKTRWANGR